EREARSALVHDGGRARAGEKAQRPVRGRAEDEAAVNGGAEGIRLNRWPRVLRLELDGADAFAACRELPQRGGYFGRQLGLARLAPHLPAVGQDAHERGPAGADDG